jgi:hypothetical protein
MHVFLPSFAVKSFLSRRRESCFRSFRCASSVHGSRHGELCPGCRMACICSVMGISTPRARARPTAAVVVKTPSATAPCMPARISGSLRPRPSSTPTLRLRDNPPGAGEDQISQASETRPWFQRLPPQATTRRVISARPRVMSAATELCPRPRPCANAGGDGDCIFQRAPEFHAYNVRVGVNPKAGIAEFLLHRSRESCIRDAMVIAVGSPRATSSANDGPLSAPHAAAVRRGSLATPA